MSDKANDNTSDDIVLAANALARLLDLQGYRHVTVALKPDGRTETILSRKFGGEHSSHD